MTEDLPNCDSIAGMSLVYVLPGRELAGYLLGACNILIEDDRIDRRAVVSRDGQAENQRKKGDRW